MKTFSISKSGAGNIRALELAGYYMHHRGFESGYIRDVGIDRWHALFDGNNIELHYDTTRKGRHLAFPRHKMEKAEVRRIKSIFKVDELVNAPKYREFAQPKDPGELTKREKRKMKNKVVANVMEIQKNFKTPLPVRDQAARDYLKSIIKPPSLWEKVYIWFMNKNIL